MKSLASKLTLTALIMIVALGVMATPAHAASSAKTLPVPMCVVGGIPIDPAAPPHGDPYYHNGEFVGTNYSVCVFNSRTGTSSMVYWFVPNIKIQA
jgi:hypothetical protein